MSTAGINNRAGPSWTPDDEFSEDAVPAERRSRNDGFEPGDGGCRNRYRTLSDASLITALKSEEPLAFVEIVARYQALLFRYARNLGVSTDRSDWISDLMHDVVLTLLKPGAVVPESLGAYFVRACRNKAYADHRASVRRQRHENDAASEEIEGGRAILTVCSEETVRNSHGPDWESAAVSPGLLKLAIKLESAITPEEREILDWSSEAVPLREMAEWLGITRTAAAQRVSRLKQRLRATAPLIASGFSPEEQAEVKRFFQRMVRPADGAALNARLRGAVLDSKTVTTATHNSAGPGEEANDVQ